MPIGLGAFVFSLGTIYGAGENDGMSALILLLLAASVWVFDVDENGKDTGKKQP